MPELISKITTLVSSTTASLALLFVAVAVCVIIVYCISLAVTHTDVKRSGILKSLGSVLVVAVIVASAAGLVNWVMS